LAQNPDPRLLKNFGFHNILQNKLTIFDITPLNFHVQNSGVEIAIGNGASKIRITD